MNEDEEIQRAIRLSLQDMEGGKGTGRTPEEFDETKVKHAVELLGNHHDKNERETAIQTLLAYARNILEHPGTFRRRTRTPQLPVVQHGTHVLGLQGSTNIGTSSNQTLH
jgi:hypothetical protein